MESEVERAVVIDAEGSTFDLLASFTRGRRVLMTPLRPSRAPGLKLKFTRGSYFRPYRDSDELRVLIGHELGHVISGHALYRTITILLLELGLQNLPFLAGIALLPIKLALLEWYRKSELSADRAGLLASQDREASLRVFLKLASGGDMAQMNLPAFMEQAKEYEQSGGPLDAIYKILNTLGASHPFNTLRAAELQRWVDAGHYARITAGEYPRRGEVRTDRTYADDVSEAATHYAREARDVAADVVDAAKRAASAFASAFKENREK